MRIFSKRSKRSSKSSAWSPQRWRGLVSSVSKTAEMYCDRFNATVASERASAAAHAAAGDNARARAAAELALRNRAKVRALARLASLADSLHARNLPIAQLASLRDLQEPARTEIVSFVYAAGRLSVQPLSEAVDMLKATYPDDVADITRARNDWPSFIDTTLYDALVPGPADSHQVDRELHAAAADYPEYAANAEEEPPRPAIIPARSPLGVPTSTSIASPTGSPLPPAIAMQSPVTGSLRSSAASPLAKLRRPPSPRPTSHTMRTPSDVLSFSGTDLGGRDDVPRPWEHPNSSRLPTSAPPFHIASPSPPTPSQVVHVQSAPVLVGPQPAYMHTFQDNEEAIAQRYRDLLS